MGVPGAPTGPRNQQFGRRDFATSPGLEARGSGSDRHPLHLEGVNEALGNRKRTYDDRIKGPTEMRNKRGKKAKADGSILDTWYARGEVMPWCVRDHSATLNMGFW
jgi:hypothetical protein